MRKGHDIKHSEKGLSCKVWGGLVRGELTHHLIETSTDLKVGDLISVSDVSNFWFVKPIKSIRTVINDYKLIEF